MADFGDFVHAQFTRQDDAFHADVLPEFHAPIVGSVGLHGQVHGHVGVFVAHFHNQAGVSHDERIGFHGDEGLHVGVKGFELAVVRQGVHGEVEFFAARVGFADALLQHVQFSKFVVTGTQGIARAAGINRVCAEIEGGLHALQAAGGE